MPLAKEVATELRVLADALDREPEAEVQKAWVSFHCDSYGDKGEKGKRVFLNLARLFPRPWTKPESSDDYIIERDTAEARIRATIARSQICKLVKEAQPAIYDCGVSLLNEAEEASLV